MKFVEWYMNNIGTECKIGFANGSGFIFCGRLEDDTMTELKETCAKIKASWEKSLNKSINALPKLCKRIEDTEISLNDPHYFDNYKEEEREDKKKEMEEMLEKMKKRKESLKTSIPTFTSRIDNCVPLIERNVVDIYHSVITDAVIVLIEGEEVGMYWDKAEYENGGAISKEDAIEEEEN